LNDLKAYLNQRLFVQKKKKKKLW